MERALDEDSLATIDLDGGQKLHLGIGVNAQEKLWADGGSGWSVGGYGFHRPQSSSASHFAAGAAGFLKVEPCRSSIICYGWHYGPHAAGAHQREFITLLGGSAAASAAQKSVHGA